MPDPASVNWDLPETQSLPFSIESDRLEAFSPETIRSYRGALERLQSWLAGKDLTDELIARYIHHLRRLGLSPASAELTLSAIRWLYRQHTNLSATSPTGPLSANALRAFRKTHNTASRDHSPIAGVTWRDADLAAAFALRDNDLRSLRDAALIRIMSDALLRVSEAARVHIEHIDITESGGTLFVPYSKTDSTGRGQSLYLGITTIEVMKTWAHAASIQSGPLFIPIRRGGYLVNSSLSTRSIRSIIKHRCSAVAKGRISSHSLRIGSAQSLAAAGASLVDMQIAGRWKSPSMPAHYASGQLAAHGAIARFRYGKTTN